LRILGYSLLTAIGEGHDGRIAAMYAWRLEIITKFNEEIMA
jgi:Flp pilus assembly CpaF family ATPase